MADKKEGATQTCKCGTKLICVKIIDTFENRNTEKLQWQNDSDHKPHFRFAGPGKFNCVMPKMDGFSESTEEHIPIKSDSLFESDKIKEIENEVDIIKEIEKIVTKQLKTNTIDPNPAKVGMYVKFIYDKLGHFQK